MAPVVGKAGGIDDRLPRRVAVAGAPAGRQRRQDGIEGVPADLLQLRPALGHRSHEDEAAERGVVAPAAARELEEHDLALAHDTDAPAGMLLAQARARPDERPETGKRSAG